MLIDYSQYHGQSRLKLDSDRQRVPECTLDCPDFNDAGHLTQKWRRQRLWSWPLEEGVQASIDYRNVQAPPSSASQVANKLTRRIAEFMLSR